MVGPSVPMQEVGPIIELLRTSCVVQFATCLLLMTIRLVSVSDIMVLFSTVLFVTIDDWMLLELMLLPLMWLLLIFESLMLLSSVVLFCMVLLVCVPLSVEAFSMVQLRAIVSISVTLISVLPVTVLFSSTELDMVLLVTFTPVAVTVFRSLAFTVPPVMLEWDIAEVSMVDVLMLLALMLDVSMAESLSCPRVTTESETVLFVIVVFSAVVLLSPLSAMELVFTVVF